MDTFCEFFIIWIVKIAMIKEDNSTWKLLHSVKNVCKIHRKTAAMETCYDEAADIGLKSYEKKSIPKMLFFSNFQISQITSTTVFLFVILGLLVGWCECWNSSGHVCNASIWLALLAICQCLAMLIVCSDCTFN